MHSAQYCKTLDAVSKEELINAVHALTLQLESNGPTAWSERLGATLDNRIALDFGNAVLTKAGHIGYSN